MAMIALRQEFKERLEFEPELLCWRASDCDKLCREVLIAGEHAEHVFGDLLERIPKKVIKAKKKTKLACA